MLSGIGQGCSFPCASSSTGRPAIVGASTTDVTWNGSCATPAAALSPKMSDATLTRIAVVIAVSLQSRSIL